MTTQMSIVVCVCESGHNNAVLPDNNIIPTREYIRP